MFSFVFKQFQRGASLHYHSGCSLYLQLLTSVTVSFYLTDECCLLGEEKSSRLLLSFTHFRMDLKQMMAQILRKCTAPWLLGQGAPHLSTLNMTSGYRKCMDGSVRWQPTAMVVDSG